VVEIRNLMSEADASKLQATLNRFLALPLLGSPPRN